MEVIHYGCVFNKPSVEVALLKVEVAWEFRSKEPVKILKNLGFKFFEGYKLLEYLLHSFAG